MRKNAKQWSQGMRVSACDMTSTYRVTPSFFSLSQKLEALLPAKPDEPVVDTEAEEVDMIDFEGTRGAEDSRREAYHDSDDEEEGVGTRMGCSHQ